MRKIGKQAGFSLLEVVIVIAVMAILSGILLGYNRRSEGQLALYSSQSKVVGFLNRAKAAALEKRERGLESKTVCAFGVRFRDTGASSPMILFADLPEDPSTGCASFSKTYNDSVNELIEQLPLDPGIEIAVATQNCSSLLSTPCPFDVVFEPPYLKTHNQGTITLGITGRNVFACVEVSSGGAVFTRDCP